MLANKGYLNQVSCIQLRLFPKQTKPFITERPCILSLKLDII